VCDIRTSGRATHPERHDALSALTTRSGTRQDERKSKIADPQSAKISTGHGVVQGYNGGAVVDEKYQIVVTAESSADGAFPCRWRDRFYRLGRPHGEICVRTAAANDADAIARIYNHFILNTVVTFEEQTVSVQEIADRINATATSALPWLVAENAGLWSVTPMPANGMRVVRIAIQQSARFTLIRPFMVEVLEPNSMTRCLAFCVAIQRALSLAPLLYLIGQV
jgi:hypothetical protein